MANGNISTIVTNIWKWRDANIFERVMFDKAKVLQDVSFCILCGLKHPTRTSFMHFHNGISTLAYVFFHNVEHWLYSGSKL